MREQYKLQQILRNRALLYAVSKRYFLGWVEVYIIRRFFWTFKRLHCIKSCILSQLKENMISIFEVYRHSISKWSNHRVLIHVNSLYLPGTDFLQMAYNGWRNYMFGNEVVFIDSSMQQYKTDLAAEKKV